MDIHKPKPWHGFREFLKEYGIIVLGVLTALALEQAVEEFHKREQITEAREAIRGELAQDLDSYVRRTEVQACINNKLSQLASIISGTRSTQSLPRPLWVGRPQIWSVSDSRLKAATSGARVALLSSAEQADFDVIYLTLRSLSEEQQAEQLAWAKLRILEVIPRMEPSDRTLLAQALNDALFANFMINLDAKQALSAAHRIGIKPEVTQGVAPGSRSVCIPLRTSRDEALRDARIGRYPAYEP